MGINLLCAFLARLRLHGQERTSSSSLWHPAMGQIDAWLEAMAENPLVAERQVADGGLRNAPDRSRHVTLRRRYIAPTALTQTPLFRFS